MPTEKKSYRAVLAIAIAAIAVAAVASYLILGSLLDQTWSNASELRNSDAGDQVPTLVESDATEIRLHSSPFTSAKQLSWSSTKGIVRDDCDAGPISDTESRSAGASWWPEAVSSTGWTCGWWTVFSDGGTFYAWNSGQP